LPTRKGLGAGWTSPDMTRDRGWVKPRSLCGSWAENWSLARPRRQCAPIKSS
jgi:hypothetical protein